jgi:lysine-specific demethylase/histidyl-hydroxylase NO66
VARWPTPTRTIRTRTRPTPTRTTPTPTLTLTTRTARADAALARCIEPVDPEDFLHEYWERAPLYVPRSGEGAFDELFSRAEAERLVTSTGLRTPGFRLVKAGDQLGGYTTDLPWRPRPFTGTADVRRVLQEFERGATIVLQALHMTHEPLATFARELELELRHPVQVNAYYTPRDAQGLPVHHDTHDVFVLQVSGEKRWRIYEPVLELPLRSQRYAAKLGGPGATVLDVTLTPGDTLYLPRGWLHEALTSGADSLHLTVGVNVITWLDALKAALDDAGDDLALRRSIDAGAADDVVQALTDRLTRADVERRRSERLARRSRPVLADGFEQLRALEWLTHETPVERRPVHVRLHEDGASLTLEFDGTQLRMPARVRAEIDAMLAASEPFTAGDLPGSLDEDGRLVLIRRLVREGFLRIV